MHYDVALRCNDNIITPSNVCSQCSHSIRSAVLALARARLGHRDSLRGHAAALCFTFRETMHIDRRIDIHLWSNYSESNSSSRGLVVAGAGVWAGAGAGARARAGAGAGAGAGALDLGLWTLDRALLVACSATFATGSEMSSKKSSKNKKGGFVTSKSLYR